MQNLAFAQTNYTSIIKSTPKTLYNLAMPYDDTVAIANIWDEDLEVTTLTGDGTLSSFTRTTINIIHFKDNPNYGVFFAGTYLSSYIYLKMYFYHKSGDGTEKVTSTEGALCSAYSSSSSGDYNSVYKMQVREHTILNNIRLITPYVSSVWPYICFFITTLIDYDGNKQKCFCSITQSSTDSTNYTRLTYCFPGGTGAVQPAVGVVGVQCLTYLGLVQLIDPNTGVTFDHIFHTSHRADSMDHFVDINGVKYYGKRCWGDTYAQFYFQDIIA
jgi:hypothetical protein